MLKLSKVKIKELKDSDYNPKSRLRGIARLAKSIDELGLIYPIVVHSADNTIIDGHRRVEACRSLDWEEIPALLSDQESPDKVYSEVNALQFKPSGNELLQVYLKNPNAVSEASRAKMVWAEETFGRKVLRELRDRGGSLGLITECKRLMSACNSESVDMLKQCVEWAMRYGMTRALRAAIGVGNLRVDLVLACIRRMKPLQSTWTEGKTKRLKSQRRER